MPSLWAPHPKGSIPPPMQSHLLEIKWDSNTWGISLRLWHLLLIARSKTVLRNVSSVGEEEELRCACYCYEIVYGKAKQAQGRECWCAEAGHTDQNSKEGQVSVKRRNKECLTALRSARCSGAGVSEDRLHRKAPGYGRTCWVQQGLCSYQHVLEGYEQRTGMISALKCSCGLLC